MSLTEFEVMAINGIQFQKGMSLSRFMVDYGTEAQCEAALVRARWPISMRTVDEALDYSSLLIQAVS